MTQPQSFENAPINWIPAFVLISTPLAALLIVPYYLWTHSVSWQVWAIFAFFMAWNGLSITVGYHRLWYLSTCRATAFGVKPSFYFLYQLALPYVWYPSLYRYQHRA